MQDGQGDEIADVLDQLHAGGWNVGDTAFFDVEDGGQVWVVTGTTGENVIRARRAPRHGGIRLTGSRRLGYFRGGLDRHRRHFRFKRNSRGCRPFSRSSRPRTGPSATDRPSRPQADLRSGSRARNPGPLSFS